MSKKVHLEVQIGAGMGAGRTQDGASGPQYPDNILFFYYLIPRHMVQTPNAYTANLLAQNCFSREDR
jgi:hypothetical protein